MAAPFIHIATYKIREGKLEELRQLLQEALKAFEAHEPRPLAVNAYANEEGTEVTIVQVHADAASFEQLTRLAHEYSFGPFVEATTSIQVYGEPSEHALQVAGGHAKAGIAVSIKPHYLGGFTRLEATK